MTLGQRALLHLTWVLPVAFWPGSTSFEPLKFTLWASAVAVWLAADGRLLATRRRLAALPCGVGAPAVLAATALAAATLGGADVRLALRPAALLLLAAATAAAVAATGPSARRRWLWGLQAGGVLTGLLALLQAAGVVPGVGPGERMAPGVAALGNPNYVAALAAALWWPATGLAASSRGRVRAAAVACLAVHAAALAVSRAAGPAAAVAGSGLLLAPAWLAARRTRALLAGRLAAAAVVTGVVFAAALGLAGAARLPLVADAPLLRANDGDLRTATWATAVAMTRAEPAWGVGAGAFPVAWIAHRPRVPADAPPAPIATRAHNAPLHWTAETGLAGLAVLALVLAFCVRAWARAAAAGGPALWAAAGLTVLAIHGAVSFPLRLPATGLVAAVFLGLLSGPAARPGPPPRRFVQALVAAAAVMLAAGAWREFAGDRAVAAGRAALLAGQPARAVERLDPGIARSLWPGHAWLHRARAHRALGHADAARRDLEAVMAVRPAYEAMALLAEDEIDRGRPAAAAAVLKQLEGCRPPWRMVLEVRYLRAYGALRRGADGQARRLLADLLREAPDLPRAHLALGYLAARTGANAEAARHYRNAAAAAARLLADPARARERTRLRGLLQVAETALRSLPADEAPLAPDAGGR